MIFFIIVIVVSLMAYFDLQHKKKIVEKFGNVEFDRYLPFLGNLHSLAVDGEFIHFLKFILVFRIYLVQHSNSSYLILEICKEQIVSLFAHL